MAFAPQYTITARAAKALMAAEADRVSIEALPILPGLIASLRESARLLSTHYSTQIEGNRLTLPEVQQVIGSRARFPGRERDEREVRNYYRAMDKAEELGTSTRDLRQRDVQVLHGLAFEGKAVPTPYRDGQNVIRNGFDGSIVYMPPEANEVAPLMKDLVDWVNLEMAARELPTPVIAALTHYQFATIHPYYDGNGRTSRLLATIVMHRCGYGLKGIYALEEYYARNLEAYYSALAVGPSHNYHLGRAEADVSGFVQYFCEGVAVAFSKIRSQAAAQQARVDASDPATIASHFRELRPLQRQAWSLFAKHRVVTSGELAAHLGLSVQQSRVQCTKWVEEGFLVVEDPSKKSRTYRLASKYEDAIKGGPY